MDDPVPIVVNIDSINDDYCKNQYKRYNNIVNKFESHFGHKPLFLARSPGRVSVIGEHIDYSYFSVIPLAIESDVVIAVSYSPINVPDDRTKCVIKIRNVDSDQFPDREINIDITDPNKRISINAAESDWANYFKCSHLDVHDYLHKSSIFDSSGYFRPVDMCILVHGTVPPGGGLSSSAAFVCSSALATLIANTTTINNTDSNSKYILPYVPKSLLTNLSISSESHMGVNSGGMDQSASIYGKKNHASLVSFKPHLHVHPIPLNPSINKDNKNKNNDAVPTFLIAHSLITAKKHDTASTNYNLRVMEVAIASCVLAKALNISLDSLPLDSNIGTATLRGVHDAYFALNEEDPLCSSEDIATNISARQKAIERLKKMEELAYKHLDHYEEGYTAEQAASALGISVDKLQTEFLSRTPVKFNTLQLKRRTIHVYSEARRVLEFYSILSTSTSQQDSDNFLIMKSLGDLMNESQDSCRDNYNVSIPEIDSICEIARKSGSFGSRVTGAGFGGSTVHLVNSNVEDILRLKLALKNEFYKVRYPSISDEEIENAMVCTKPSSGSSVIYPIPACFTSSN